MSNQRTLSSLTFRDFRPEDYAWLVEIYNANYPDYAVSISEQRAFDESIDSSKYLLKRFAATDQTGRVLGFGQIRHVLDVYHPRKFMISIWVDPLEQGKGVGTRIYGKIMEELDQLNAIVAWAFSREDLPNLREFYLHRGFREISRDWESRLDVTNVDTGKVQEHVHNVSRQGITFTTLAEERRRNESLKALYELVQLVVADMPREGPYTPVSYEQWEAFMFNNPRLLPEGYIIAKHGSEYVGISYVMRNEKEPQVLTQDDTGVRRDYRGRGIAVVMKVKIVEFAQKHGYKMIKTWNDSTNVAMLAINTKLGFKRQTGWIRMGKMVHSETPS
jgi:GNAT superfamily N-acetyltransferase